MVRRRAWIYTGALILASCSFVTDSCACVLIPSSAHVVGTVTVTGGGEAFVAMMTSIHRGACGAPASGNLVDQGTINVPVGAYRLSFAVVEGMQCAVVTAAVGQRTKRDSVSVMSSFQSDSSRLDLVVP